MIDHTRTIWEKAAHVGPAFPQAAGFGVIPVHHSAVEILGERAYRSVIDIDEPVDVVTVFRPAEEAPELAGRRWRSAPRCCVMGSPGHGRFLRHD